MWSDIHNYIHIYSMCVYFVSIYVSVFIYTCMYIYTHICIYVFFQKFIKRCVLGKKGGFKKIDFHFLMNSGMHPYTR